MAVLLDTATIPADDRLEVLRTAMVEASGASGVDMETVPEGVSGRMDLWSFGASRIFTAQTSGITMVRDAKAARGASLEAVAVAVQGVGQGLHETGTEQRIVRTGDVMVVDVTRPFNFAWRGRGSSTSLQVPTAELGLPLGLVQQAGPRLASSPLYRTFSRHLVDLTRQANTLSASPMAAALGESTTHLVRALLVGALDEDASRSRAMIEQTLLSQVHAYVRQNLRDPTLGPDSVAAALAVSRRQLFRVCARADFSLQQYVIGKRLEGAKAELGTHAGRSRSIAVIAFRWGFRDPTHFSRRFKATYGLLPRDWRRLAEEEYGLLQ